MVKINMAIKAEVVGRKTDLRAVDTIATPEEAIMVVIGGIGVSVDSVEEESIEIKGKQELFDNGDDFRLDYIPVLQYMAER